VCVCVCVSVLEEEEGDRRLFTTEVLWIGHFEVVTPFLFPLSVCTPLGSERDERP